MVLRKLSALLLGTAFVLLSLFFYAERAFSIGSINPNLPLIVFLLLLFGYRMRFSFFVLLLIFVGAGLLWMPFWIPSFVLLAVLLAGFGLLRSFCTGTVFLDFLIVLSLSTLLLAFFSILATQASWDTVRVLEELAYHLLLGSFLWIVVRERGSLRGLLRKERSVSI